MEYTEEMEYTEVKDELGKFIQFNVRFYDPTTDKTYKCQGDLNPDFILDNPEAASKAISIVVQRTLNQVKSSIEERSK